MSFYSFVADEFKKVIDDSRFIECFKFGINEDWVTSKHNFKGDPIILDKLLDVQRKSGKKVVDDIICGNYDILKEYSLPYLSYCQDDNDISIRNQLLNKVTDKYDIYWWCFIHSCEFEAIFIILPMCKLLFPNIKFYLYHGNQHNVILNRPLSEYKNYSKLPYTTQDINSPCIFDIISLAINENKDWIFDGNDAFDNNRCIDEDHIIEWYVDNYGYSNYDITTMKKIFYILYNDK
jgi:hypothetical protein